LVLQADSKPVPHRAESAGHSQMMSRFVNCTCSICCNQHNGAMCYAEYDTAVDFLSLY